MFMLKFTETTMFSLDDLRIVDANTSEVCIEPSEIALAQVLRGRDGVVDQLLVVNVVKRSTEPEQCVKKAADCHACLRTDEALQQSQHHCGLRHSQQGWLMCSQLP